MKTATLAQALKLAKSSLLSIDFVPILTHFCFFDDVLFTYNDISAVVVDMQTGLSLGVKGDTLLGVLPTLGAEVELLSNTDGNALELKSGKARVELATMPADAFLFEPPDDPALLLINCTQEVIKGFARCVATVGLNAMHREFTGVTFLYNEKQGVDIYSTDDTRLSHFAIDGDDVQVQKAKVGQQWLIPAQSVRQLVEVFNARDLTDGKDAGPEVLALCTNWAIFTAPGVTVYSKLMPETPPDYRGMMAQVLPPAAAWQPMPAGLVIAFKRAEVLTGKETQPRLSVRVKDKALNLEVEKGTAAGNFTEAFLLAKPVSKVDLVVDPGKSREAAEVATSIALHERCLGFQVDSYRCLVAPLKTAE